jgi:hypothetical protein
MANGPQTVCVLRIRDIDRYGPGLGSALGQRECLPQRILPLMLEFDQQKSFDVGTEARGHSM